MELIVMFLYIVFFVFVLAMLVNAAGTKQWFWFVLMLVFFPVALLYILLAYQSSKKLDDEDRRQRERSRKRERARKQEMLELRKEIDELKAVRPDAAGPRR